MLVPLWAEDEAGIRVVRADDGWFLGARKLKPGDALGATAELKGTQATPLILACGKTAWLSYVCSNNGCRVPACSKEVEGVKVQRVDVHAADPEAQSEPSNLLSSFLRHERKTPQTLGVRAGGNPNDAVVLATAAAVHWGPALLRVLEGRYCFRVAPLPDGAARTFTLDWDRSSDNRGLSPGFILPPGVYSLEKANSDCRFDDPDRTPAWVVVAPEAEFSHVDAEWKAYALSIRKLEQDGASPAVVSTVRHAVLATLADSLGTK
jgi:hypothetical protein